MRHCGSGARDLMGQTLSNPASPNLVRTSDNIGQRSPQRPSFAQTVADAIRAHYGSVKAAAYALGQCDPSLMTREFSAGDFARFDRHATDDTMAAVVAALYEVYCKQLDLHARSVEALNRAEAARAIRTLRSTVNSQLDHMLESLL